MASLTEISQMLRDFSEDRPTLHESNTPELIIELIHKEVVEASQSLTDTENLASELSDIIIFTLTMANLYGFNMDLEVREKIALNSIRFPASKFQTGDYDQTRKECKQLEQPIIKNFYDI